MREDIKFWKNKKQISQCLFFFLKWEYIMKKKMWGDDENTSSHQIDDEMKTKCPHFLNYIVAWTSLLRKVKRLQETSKSLNNKSSIKPINLVKCEVSTQYLTVGKF